MGAGLVEDTRKFENPPNMFIVKLILFIFVIKLIIGIIFLGIQWGPYDGWISFFLLTGGGSLFLFAIWYRQYFTRPKIVEISADGLILHMSSSKEVKLGWSDVLGYWADSEETDAEKEKAGSGKIIPTNGPIYSINYFIAISVAYEYHRITGRYLPSAKMDEWGRAFKKRVVNSN